ncbi:minichromosome maintenance protein 8 [Volvox carteri f. nagariensis]|uniref:Probable DNA helicase MCM8 n=1 Tax=Volvox carteri f. nagariensis TaxID=3068 RepID=D8UK59_VOLCA|nr:minichromosome maintenance protein 8 [Volvox carteri f. nagariensis]EFJ39894.1 minichromosome maintenance protein 8 [Volvox carteri f. nagariensis]|eukprot:XP_002959033.1 minichromosome maintenance protein 8 [Volvox carteri f. nagariensis]
MAAPAAAQAPSAPPAAWADYFPPQEYSRSDRRALLIHDLITFFVSGGGHTFVEALRPRGGGGEYSLEIDFASLESQSGLLDLPAAIEGSPVEALGCIAVAAYEAAFIHRKGRLLGHNLSTPPPPPPAGAGAAGGRAMGGEGVSGKLVTLRGTVVRMTPVRPLVTRLDFVCAKCGSTTGVNFADGVYTLPTKCTGDGCRSRTFTPLRSSARCVDWQKIRLQRCSVLRALLHHQAVMAVGGGKFAPTGAASGGAGGGRGAGGSGGGGRGVGGGGGGGGGGGSSSSLFLMYLEAVSLSCPRQQLGASGMQAPSLGDMSLSGWGSGFGGGVGPGCRTGDPAALPSFISKDLAFVVKFCESYGGDQLRQLVHALCPSIYGNELVKCGIVLAMLGGVRKNTGGDGGAIRGAAAAGGGDSGGRTAGGGGGVGRVPVRGDIHVLVVGDPGLGKSQLLKAAAAAAPRGIYVCGNTSTSAGLTVSVVRDAVTGDAALEAGAVVLSDCGALLEVMEQQEVSIAKAGLVANLPARASMLAAANPAGGHYSRAKSLAENLRGISPAMLSRFDLIFVLLDRPDERLDQALSEHVMALHSGLADRAHAARQRLIEYGTTASGANRFLTASGTFTASQATTSSQGLAGGRPGESGVDLGAGFGAGARPTLSQRLKLASADDNAQLPVPLLKKFVSYARTYCHPRLSEEAKQVIQTFYLQMRAQAAPGSKNPVTARQLESLVRLSEARARAELREVVEKSDAEDVVELVREALYDRGLFMALCNVKAGGRAGSRSGETSRFMAALHRLAAREGRCVFSVGELTSLANEIALAVRDVGTFLDQLNEAGQLLKRGPGQYKVEGVVAPAAAMSTQNGGSVCG